MFTPEQVERLARQPGLQKFYAGRIIVGFNSESDGRRLLVLNRGHHAVILRKIVRRHPVPGVVAVRRGCMVGKTQLRHTAARGRKLVFLRHAGGMFA